MLTGGILDDKLERIFKGKGDGSSPFSMKSKADGTGGLGGPMGAYESGWTSESLIREKSKDKKKKTVKSESDYLLDLLNNDKVKALMKKNSSGASNAAEQVTKNTLKEIYEQVSAVSAAKSLDALEKLVGKNVPELQQLNKLPDNEKKAAMAATLDIVKKSVKEMAIQSLKQRVKAAISAGLYEDHPFVKDHTNLIEKIKAM